MKQLLQALDSGSTTISDVPIPRPGRRDVVVQTAASLISAGTERMLVDFGRSNLLEKARQQPEKVLQVLNKAGTEGVRATLDAVRSKLGTPIPLGYCNAGRVAAVGSDAGGVSVGDRVVTNGPHAEFVRVSRTLVARIPDEVEDQQAAFAPLAAVGLQGVRLADPTLGETIVVYGLGLVGLLTAQIALANGCRVIGIDTNRTRLDLAEAFGSIPVDASNGNVVEQVLSHTGSAGADAVLLTLASSSDKPIGLAADMSRVRGRIVLVGVTGLELSRQKFYEKELSFQVSMSYGPGRYDPTYEDGQDYPLPYVRWTEQRNFEAVLGLMARGRLQVAPLITHEFIFSDAPKAYDLLSSGEPSLGIILTYPGVAAADQDAGSTIQVTTPAPHNRPATGAAFGVIGAGNFAQRTFLPLLQNQDVLVKEIASTGGTDAAIAARKFGIEAATSDPSRVISSTALAGIFVLTRHDSHAELAVRALEAGKHVFVEKPLALTEPELDAVIAAARSAETSLLVGFNRRFSPHAAAVRGLLEGRAGPLMITATVNAGTIPGDHWTQDRNLGGGRIVGEACHWIDLARFFTGSPITAIGTMAARNRKGIPLEDIAAVSLGFEDGSLAQVNYVSSGAASFAKERITLFWDSKTAVIENWRVVRKYGLGRAGIQLRRPVEKGHAEEIRAWVTAVQSGSPSPIPLDEIEEVSRWSIRAADRIRAGSR